MNPIRLLNMGMINSIETQSAYHAVAELMDDTTVDTIIINRAESPYICVGFHQSTDSIIDRDECEKRGLPIVRRKLGGGTTYMDENQLLYQSIFHRNALPGKFSRIYSMMLSAPVETLKEFGFSAQLKGVNEIEVDGKRIAGTGGGQIGEASVVVGNFLFDFDFEAMTSLWKTPWDSFLPLADKAIRDRITTIWEHDESIKIEDVTSKLIERFSIAFDRPLEEGELSSAESALSKELVDKLTSEEFVYEFENSKERYEPLKISADVFVHAEESNIGENSYRGCFVSTDNRIGDSIIEQYNGSVWEQISLEIRGLPASAWNRELTA